MEYYSTEKINDHITLLRSITGELLYLSGERAGKSGAH